MPFSGNGTWTNVYNWVSDAAAGIKILASRQQTQWDDIASNGLSNVICKDGQTTTTAPIPFGSGITLSGGSTLANYATGPWTPSDGSGAGLVFTTISATYVRVGPLVTCFVSFIYPATANGANAVVAGLPLPVADVQYMSGQRFNLASVATAVFVSPIRNTSTISVLNSGGTSIINSALTAASFVANFSYITT